MQTSSPISTISFNTPAFLENALERLREDGLISSWYYICHKPEDDECGNKEHCHVYVVPALRISTDSISSYFFEFDPTFPTKPRKCISWRKSKTFGDWYLYGLHDEIYLASKGQSRVHHYFYEDVKASDYDDLYYDVNTIDMTELTPYACILDAITNGISWESYFMRGSVPIAQFNSYKAAYEVLWKNIYEPPRTDRNGRKGHD